MGIILAILLFSFIVFFHELGHFLLAKKNGIDVDEFAIGMGPAIYSKEYKGTRYAVRILPIGGFCAMGEDEEANDSPNNFNNKSVWARISVIAAGPVFNFILAFIFAVIITAMVGYDKPVIGAVESGYPATGSLSQIISANRVSTGPIFKSLIGSPPRFTTCRPSTCSLQCVNQIVKGAFKEKTPGERHEKGNQRVEKAFSSR